MANGKPEKKPKKYPPEGYQIYVRVPEDSRTTAEDVQAFLEQLAHLLTDNRKEVVVEPYLEKDPDVKKMAKPGATGGPPVKKAAAARGGGGGGAALAAGAAGSGTGGRKSPLYPMYVCHGKM